jgi:hypothetical protein
MQVVIGYSVRVGQRCIGHSGSVDGRFLCFSFFTPNDLGGDWHGSGWDLRFTAFYVFSTYFWRLECLAGSVFVSLRAVYDLMLVRSLISSTLFSLLGWGLSLEPSILLSETWVEGFYCMVPRWLVRSFITRLHFWHWPVIASIEGVSTMQVCTNWKWVKVRQILTP